MRIPRSRVITLVIGVIVSCLGISTVAAVPITVDWDVVPHGAQHIEHGDSPFYECSGDFYSARLCQSLWDEGLELGAISFSFYDDKFVDGYGVGEEEADIGIGLSGGQRISPLCKTGLPPCFDSFTPVTLRIVGASNLGPDPNLFVISSKGGLVKLPSLSGLTSVSLSGSVWEDLSWLEIGFYIADDCEDVECEVATEKAFWVEDLTFEGRAVPEPALTAVLGTAIAAAFGRRAVTVRRRRNR